MTFPTEQPHGPVCIGLDAGCPDCQRLHSVGIGAGRQKLAASAHSAFVPAEALAAPPGTPHGPICIGADNGCPDCKRLQAVDNDSPLPRPSDADLERWNTAARCVPGPMGRCIRILLGEVERLQNENEKLASLLTTKPERP